MKSTGQRVKAQREKLGLSQAELANRVGISAPSLSLLENGRIKQSRHLQAIAEALNVSARWLEGRRSGPAPRQPRLAARRATASEGSLPPKVVRLAESLLNLRQDQLKALMVLAGIK